MPLNATKKVANATKKVAKVANSTILYKIFYTILYKKMKV